MFSKWLNSNWRPGPFSNSVFKTSTLHWLLEECLFSVVLIAGCHKHGSFNTNWFSYVSRHRKPYTALVGPKSKRPPDWVPFGGSRDKSISLTFAHTHSLSHGPVFEISKSWSSLLHMASDLLICLRLVLLKILWLCWAHLVIQKNLLTGRPKTIITHSKAFSSPCQVTCSHCLWFQD